MRANDDWDEECDADDEHDSDENESTNDCPSCGRQIYEDAPRCPYCGHYVSAAEFNPRRKPWWLVLGVIACLYVVYRWVRG